MGHPSSVNEPSVNEPSVNKPSVNKPSVNPNLVWIHRVRIPWVQIRNQCKSKTSANFSSANQKLVGIKKKYY
jgi:hypothetical protein